MHTLNDIFRFAVSLVSIVNPLGAIPVFLGLTQRKKDLNVHVISTSAALTTSITLLTSLIFGRLIIRFFGISVSSFTIGGGVLLFMTALGMISSRQVGDSALNKTEPKDVGSEKEIGMIPLAIPLLAGPGAISIAIISAKGFDSPMHWVGGIAVIFLIGILVKVMLKFSHEIGHRMGQVGINVMTRIMGLILLATSIEMLASGLRELLPALKGGLGLLTS